MSLAQCRREEVLSLQDLIQMVLRRVVPLVVKEDNSACIQAVRKGYSPTLRHLKRTQRISLGELHEAFEERGAEATGDGPVTLEHAETKTHKGDVFTKYMSPASYKDAVARLGVATRQARVAGAAASYRSSAQVRRRPTDGRATLPPSPLPPTTASTLATTRTTTSQRKPRQRRRRHHRQQQPQQQPLQQQLSFQ